MEAILRALFLQITLDSQAKLGRNVIPILYKPKALTIQTFGGQGRSFANFGCRNVVSVLRVTRRLKRKR